MYMVIRSKFRKLSTMFPKQIINSSDVHCKYDILTPGLIFRTGQNITSHWWFTLEEVNKENMNRKQ